MPAYVPRLSRQGISGSQYWYSNTNPFYPTYALPNCTCYAWGRTWESSGSPPYGFPTGDGGTWWGHADNYQRGQTPKLGAVLCMSGGPVGTSGRGHVAVVEKIYSDGSILFSNSGYYRGDDPQVWNNLYFYLRCASPDDNYQTGRHGWSGYGGYNIQGFIYNPVDFDPEIDPGTPDPGPGPGPEPGLYPTRLLLYKKQIYRNQGRLVDDIYK